MGAPRAQQASSLVSASMLDLVISRLGSNVVGLIRRHPPCQQNRVVNCSEDRMWSCRARLGTVMMHLLSSRTVLDLTNKFMDCGCISLHLNKYVCDFLTFQNNIKVSGMS
jgi:hypothetical protein